MAVPPDVPFVLPDQIPHAGDRHAVRAYYAEILGRWAQAGEGARAVELEGVRAGLALLLASLEGAGLARRGSATWSRLAGDHVVRDGAALYCDLEGLAESLAALWLGSAR